MTTTVFLMLLYSFSVLSGLVTEGIKKIVTDKANLPYNIIALSSAFVIGGGGTTLYFQLNAIPVAFDQIIQIILMGLASGLVSMVGFDKVKQAIAQMTDQNQ